MVCHEKVLPLVVRDRFSYEISTRSDADLRRLVSLTSCRMAKEVVDGLQELQMKRRSVREVSPTSWKVEKEESYLDVEGIKWVRADPWQLPKRADDFVVNYDVAKQTDLKRHAWKKGASEFDFGGQVPSGKGNMYVCTMSRRWIEAKNEFEIDCLEVFRYLEVEVEYQRVSGLLLQPELPEVEVEDN
ncbi:hypothetical protein Tco_0754051 [Tanacetum coccineum]